MMDDAFVYFRYADNLLFLGRGLVYNPGEFVEGYSSPLWMLVLLPLRALGLDYYALILALALASVVGYGAAMIAVNRRLSPADAPIVNVPLAASAAHYGITTHFSSGLETPLVQLLAPLYALALLTPASVALQCVIALAPLVRAECGLLAALYLPYVILCTRRVPWWFLGCGVVANGGWLTFRLIYYADFLPNTFYLKDSAQWELGVDYWRNVVDTHHLGLWALILALCAVLGRSQLRREWGARAVMAASVLLYALYVARIGGDMLYHRYAALPVCLGLCATAGFAEAAIAWIASRWPLRHLQLAAAAVAVLIGAAFGLAYPPQLLAHPFFLARHSRKWHVIADPNWHRWHPELTYDADRAAQDASQREGYAQLRAALSSPTPPMPRIAVEGFCVVAYREFDAIVVHDFGLTDPVLARLPRHFGRPGHKLVQNEAAQMARLKILARTQGGEWYAQARTPRWVQKNQAVLAQLDRKLHNQHDLAENLKLALTTLTLK
jgi:hypothetical protein